MKIKVALGRGNNSSSVVNKELSYDEFKRTVCGFKPVKTHYNDDYIGEVKSKLTWFIAGEFNPAKRKTENLLARSCIVLDVDNYKGTIEELESQVKKDLAGLKYMCYSTASHTPKAPKIRIVLVLKESIEPSKYDALSRQFVANKISFADAVDAASYKPNQFMYVASDITVIDAPEELHYQKWYIEEDGELLDPSSYGLDLIDTSKTSNVVDLNHIPVGTKRVLEHLQQYPAESLEFHDWLEVAMALHHNYQASDEGYKILDQWSMKDELRYNELENRKYWDSFKDKSNVKTFSSIIYKVKQQDNSSGKRLAESEIRKLGPDNFTEQGLIEVMRHLAKSCTAVEVEPYLKEIKDRTKVLLPDLRSLFRRANKEQTLGQKVKYKDVIFEIDKPLPPELFVDYVDNDKPPKTVIQNLQVLLKYYNISLRRNLISREDELTIPNCGFNEETKDEASFAAITSLCEFNNMSKSYHLNGYCISIASQNAYNPVLNFITSKPWDGRSRLQELYNTVIVEEGFDVTLKELLMRKWLISAIAAAAEERGVFTKGVLIFQSKQSTGKTTWFKSLVPKDISDYFKDGCHVDPKNKDSIKTVISKWIAELGEIESTLNKDIAMLKAFLSSSKDMFRIVWGKRDTKFARRTVFCGTVNSLEFLKDRTGNVRYWPIAVKQLLSTNSIDMQQVWAEVYEIYKLGERWWLETDEETILEKSNENFLETCPYEEFISQYFKPYSEDIKKCPDINKKNATEILIKMRGILGSAINIDQRGTRTVVSALSRLGFRRELGNKKRYYVECA